MDEVPGSGPGGASAETPIDWEKFKERFTRISQRMVNKMQANASYMAMAYKKQWQKLRDSIKDDDNRGRGG
jgi:hypothetical protein